jgi:translocator protein
MPTYLKFIISLLAPQLAGGLGALATASSVSSWYLTLEKPSFNPPSWVFGPVWITLYVLIGLAAFMVWKANDKDTRGPMRWYWAQLALNALWSPAFFGMQSPLLGLVVIVPLWVFILITLQKFYRINSVSAYLMMPYLLWVSFATVLNASLFWLNG